MKTVNVENIEKRIAWINSTIKNDSLTKYMLPIQLKGLRFERDCLCKLRELMENKPNSQNPVDGDVQALIADCQAEIEDLKRSIDRCDAIGTSDYLYHLQSKLKRQYAALAALTAQPYVYASGNTDMSKESPYFSASVFNNAWGEEYTMPLYTTPPAQLLRPVELPDIKTARSDWSAWNWIEHLGGRFQNGQPGDYVELGSVYAVAQLLKQYRRTVTAEVIAEIADSLRQQGYEVKND